MAFGQHFPGSYDLTDLATPPFEPSKDCDIQM